MVQDAKKYIRRYFNERGLTYASSGLDAYLFLVSEVGEVGDAIVHSRDEWVRNHPDKTRDLKEELADAYMMLAITADLFGVDLDEALLEKMANKGYDYRGSQRKVVMYKKEG